jgi:hypothetical protein
VREVYAQTCHHFSKQGMLDTELFGLAVLMGKFHKICDNLTINRSIKKIPLNQRQQQQLKKKSEMK